MLSRRWFQVKLWVKTCLLRTCVCIQVCGWAHKSPSLSYIFYESLRETAVVLTYTIRILHFVLISIQTGTAVRKCESSEGEKERGWKCSYAAWRSNKPIYIYSLKKNMHILYLSHSRNTRKWTFICCKLMFCYCISFGGLHSNYWCINVSAVFTCC